VTETVVADPRQRSRARLVAIGGVVVASAVSIVLRLNAPLVLQSDWHADDALFASHASHLLEGEWLGPYDLWTVAKGPVYPCSSPRSTRPTSP
jgi:hypothetical protein